MYIGARMHDASPGSWCGATGSGPRLRSALRAYYVENDREPNYARAAQLATEAIPRVGGGPRREVAGAYAGQGVIALCRDRDLLAARVALRTAVQVDSAFIPAYEHLTMVYLYERRFKHARETVAAGLRMDPTAFASKTLGGQIHYFASDSLAAWILANVTEQQPCISARSPSITRPRGFVRSGLSSALAPNCRRVR